jgi:hypothetical protein
MTRFNETELCNTILLPYLKALNIDYSQITLEESFSIRLGHTVVDIKNKKRDKISGRLDVLVKNADGDNLFVVELKAPDQQLTQDDANQGISYARLLDQIAPFVIVSNGKKTKIYDTITKKTIEKADIGGQSDFWGNQRQLSTQEDLNIRFEALQNFLGYSSENILLFCKSQNERGMNALKGSQNNRKYNPETYIKRENVRDAIGSFLNSDSTVFAILGESGVGKTNEMCAITEDLGSDHIVLFINATEISESVEKSLSNEFNWGFSEQINFTEIVRRLSKLGKILNKKIIIIIDSLDEAVAVNFERSISELASNISTSQGIVKLITSVKTSDWPRFSQLRGSISKLNLLLDKSWYESEANNEDPKPYILTQLNDTEKKSALDAYSSFYNLADIPEGSVKNYCSHPFLLRVIGELYANKKQIPHDLSEEKLIESWIQKKLNQIDDSGQYRLVLISLAEAIYNESLTKNNVTYGELWQASVLSIIKVSTTSETNSMYKQLESIGFVSSQLDYTGIKHYSFYYGPVRDYFLARYILNLNEMTAEELSHKVPDILNNSILRSALFWHLRKAPSPQIFAVKSLIISRATEFINTYNDIANHLFPNLKHYLPPYIRGDVGVCFINKGEWLEFALFPITKEKNKRVIELKYSMNDKESYKEISELKAISLRGGGTNFLNGDPQLSAVELALEKVNEAIEKGNLNESTNKILLQEGVLAIISTNDFLHNNSELYRGMNKNLPLNLDSIHKQVQVAFGRNSYERNWRDEYIAKQRKSNPHQTGFSIPLMPFDTRKEYDKSILTKIGEGETFAAPNINNDDELKIITSLIEQLSMHETVISKSTLPTPDLSILSHNSDEFSNYSDEALIQSIKLFYTKVFDVYKDVVKYNFSGLTHKLNLIKKIPYRIYVEINRQDNNRWGVNYTYQINVSKNTEVFVKIDPIERFFNFSNGEFVIDGVISDFYSTGGTSLSNILTPYHGPGFNQESAGFTNQMPIRTFVYDLIKDDFKNITEDDLLTELKLIYNSH